ncbi:hypothetical protein Tco_0124425 [Tanacetum coccineum]
MTSSSERTTLAFLLAFPSTSNAPILSENGESRGVGKWCSTLGDGCVGDGCVGDGCVGDGYAGDDCAGDGCVGSTMICSGVRECVEEGECSGEWEGEDVILEGEGEGSGTCSIVRNRSTSCPENPLVGLFILLNTFMLSEGTGYNLVCC